MTVFVRVRLENGTEASIPERVAAAAGLTPLKKSAVGRDGQPLPPKHRVLAKKDAVSADHPHPEAPASDAPKEG